MTTNVLEGDDMKYFRKPGKRWFAVATIALFAACGGCDEDDNPTTDMAMPDVGVDAAQDMVVEDTRVADLGPVDMAAAPCTTAGCPDTLVCDETSGACVECLDASQCGSDTPICRRNECIACLTDLECATAAESNPVAGSTCHSRGACVGCEADSDCPATSPFCGGDNECFACRNNAECPEEGPLCSDGACVSCADAAGCTIAERFGELRSRACRSAIRFEGLLQGPEAALYDAIQAYFCADVYDFDPDSTAFRAAVLSGRISLDVAEFDRCLQGATSCNDALVPTVADGETCWFDGECRSGRCDEASTCPGTCRDLAAEGEGCTISSNCYAGLSCVAGTCVDPPAVGQPCSGSCVDNAYCSSGFCVAKGVVGTACATGIQCESGLYCDSMLGVCSNSAGPGEPCLAIPNTRQCEEGVRCLNSVCQPPQPVGSTCTDSAQCAQSLRCVDGECAEILLAGANCSNSAHCARGLRCSNSRCQPLPDVGEACVTSEGCIRGECSAGVCVSRAPGAACNFGTAFRDFFDVCGDAASCGSGGICVAEAALGQVCGGANPDCRQPNLTCQAGTCAVDCGLQAP